MAADGKILSNITRKLSRRYSQRLLTAVTTFTCSSSPDKAKVIQFPLPSPYYCAWIENVDGDGYRNILS